MIRFISKIVFSMTIQCEISTTQRDKNTIACAPQKENAIITHDATKGQIVHPFLD